jgi:hypothetical protein
VKGEEVRQLPDDAPLAEGAATNAVNHHAVQPFTATPGWFGSIRPFIVGLP